MKKILVLLIPLLLMIAGITWAILPNYLTLLQPDPLSVDNILPFTGTCDTVCADDVITFSYDDSLAYITGDSLVGCKIIFPDSGFIANIIMVRDSNDCSGTDRVGSLYVYPDLRNAPANGTPYVVIPYYGSYEQTTYPYGYVSSVKYFNSWDVAKGDTTRSVGVNWNKLSYGDKYNFLYFYQADTCYNDTFTAVANGDSTSIKIWYEVSFDGYNWIIPDGSSPIDASVTDYTLHVVEVNLPEGVPEFRIVTTGNAGNSGMKGMQWLNHWIVFPK